MAEITEDTDRRINERVGLERMMFLRVGEQTFNGVLRDVSSNGARFVFDADADDSGNLEAGEDGTIVVDGIGEVTGTVARLEGNAAVFTFDVTIRGQEEIIANIMIAQNEIDLKPEN